MLTIDDRGAVVLTDERLLAIEGAYLTGGGDPEGPKRNSICSGTTNSNCINDFKCTNSTNSTCTNEVTCAIEVPE